MSNKRGALIDRGLEKLPKFTKREGQSKRGVGICEKALNDYTRTERTETGCHSA